LIFALTTNDPHFLKAAYPHPEIELTDHERHIPTGTPYIKFWNGLWVVWEMTPERVPIPLGKFKTINSAIFAIKN
jgi:hypothetical protein